MLVDADQTATTTGLTVVTGATCDPGPNVPRRTEQPRNVRPGQTEVVGDLVKADPPQPQYDGLLPQLFGLVSHLNLRRQVTILSCSAPFHGRSDHHS